MQKAPWYIIALPIPLVRQYRKLASYMEDTSFLPVSPKLAEPIGSLQMLERTPLYFLSLLYSLLVDETVALR